VGGPAVSTRKPAKIRLLLVDDHEVVRLGLRTAFERYGDIDVVGEADTTAAAVAEALRLKPDLILMDLRLPGGGGVQACREILAEAPDCGVLFLTSYSDRDAVLSAAFAGARGYLLKEIGTETLVQSIRAAAAGQTILDVSVNEQVIAWMKANAGEEAQPSGASQLSAQERRVVLLVAEGKSNKEIAAALELSPKTVRNYLSNVFDKLQLSRRAEIITKFGGQGRSGSDR
jgi:two-component system, NarL family, response regulator DevR